MKLQGIVSGYAFSRSPIFVNGTYPETAFDRNGGKFTITYGGEPVYEGRFFPPLEMDISEILDANVPFFAEPPEDATGPVAVIEDAGEFSGRDCIASFEYAGIKSGVEFTVVPGGVSRQNRKRLLAVGQDPFSARFLNPRNNFFMTTRTADWRIIIKETELYPLYFLVDRNGENLTAVEGMTDSGLSLSLGALDIGVNALDINALRRQFMTGSGIIPNIFDIYRNGVFSCQIVIEESDIARERYRLKFRNSLGVFEIIELTGGLTISPGYPEAGEASFKRYDSFTGGFHNDRERIERKQSVTVETGVKRPDEVRFLMDMIGSEEVYLLDLAPTPLKVIPSVENFSYRPRPETPESFTLKLEIAESETNIMQDIIDGSEGRKPRVFSKEFSKEFN